MVDGRGVSLSSTGEAKVKIPIPCRKCPFRLSNGKHYCVRGKGNTAGFMVVLPNVTYKDKNDITNNSIFKELESTYQFVTGDSLLRDSYVTSILKCYETESVPFNADVFNNCKQLLFSELVFTNASIVLLLGNAVELMLGIPIKDTIGKIYHVRGRYFITNYNPLVKIYSEENAKIFTGIFYTFISAVKHNDFSNYKLVEL